MLLLIKLINITNITYNKYYIQKDRKIERQKDRKIDRQRERDNNKYKYSFTKK